MRTLGGCAAAGGPLVAGEVRRCHALPTLDRLVQADHAQLSVSAMQTVSRMATAGLLQDDADRDRWRERMLALLCGPDSGPELRQACVQGLAGSYGRLCWHSCGLLVH